MHSFSKKFLNFKGHPSTGRWLFSAGVLTRPELERTLGQPGSPLKVGSGDRLACEPP